MKKAFVVTISPGYMFSLNCNFNSNKYFGTNADFHILYHPEMEKDYMDACTKAFSEFNIIWIPIDYYDFDYPNMYAAFFAAKYKRALEICDEYDSVCIIDGDYFICSNVNKYFQESVNGKFITATHVHSGLAVEDFSWNNHEQINNRCVCTFADFPVFFNCKTDKEMLKDWHDFSFAYPQGDERSHPLIAFNKAIAKHKSKKDTIALNGRTWVFDAEYWTVKAIVKGTQIFREDGDMLNAIHNRWWQKGRGNVEITGNRHSPHINTAIYNFNSIRDYMAMFNDMTEESKWHDYEKKTFA